MWIRKSLLAVLVAGTIMLALGGGSTMAQRPEPAAISMSAVPHVGQEIVVSDLDDEDYLPAAVYNGKHREYLVVWHTAWTVGTRDIRAARISHTGQMLSTFLVYEHPTRDSAQPSVAYDPVHDRYLVTWVFDAFGDGSDWDLYGRLIPWDGPNPAMSEFVIADWSTHQWNPKVAYGQTVDEFLVVWMNEYQGGVLPAYISGRRIRAADGAFPGGATDLTISHGSQNRVNPDVAYNLARNEYLVVYDNAADILATRYTGRLDHNFGGEFGIAGWPAGETRPAVAACREVNQYLVAWQSDQSTANDAIYARIIGGDGAPGGVYQIDDTTSPEQEADVACNEAGTKYMVAWQTRYTNLQFGVWARMVQPNGTLEPSFAVAHPGASTSRRNPAAAGGHSNYLIAWEHERDDTAYQDIHARLVSPYAAFVPLALRDY